MVLLLLLALLIANTVLFVVAMWFLDFAVWYGHSYMYLPLLAWGVRFSKGDAVNIAYWWLVLCLAAQTVISFELGRRLGDVYKRVEARG